MAQIRPYIAQVSPQATIPSRQAQESDTYGPGLVNLGQSIQQAGGQFAHAEAYRLQEIQKEKEQASHIAIQEMASNHLLSSLQAEQTRQSTMNPAYPDAHVNEAITTGKNYVEDAIGKIAEDPQSPVLPKDFPKLRLALSQNNNHVTYTASQYASKANAEYQVKQADTTYINMKNTVQASPELMVPMIQRSEELANGFLTIGEGHREKIRTEYRQGLIGSSMDGQVDAVAKLHSLDAIQALRTTLVNPKDMWQKESHPTDYARALDRLNGLEEHEKAQRDLLADAAFKERRAERASGVANGFDPIKESSHVTDPAKRELLMKDGRAAIHTGEAVSAMSHGSFESQVAMLRQGEAALHTAGRFFEDSEVHTAQKVVFAQRMESIKTDLAAEAMKNASVQQALKEMNPNDPVSVDQYVRAMTAETQRIAPWREPNLLTRDQTGQVKFMLSAIDSGPTGADQALRIISGERQRWGQHWPMVLRQMTQEEVLTGDQAVAARMGQDPGKQPDAKILLSTAQLKPHELDKLLPPGTRGEVQKTIQQALDPVRQAMMGQVAGDKELARYQSGSENLALGYMLRGETSVQNAVEKAVGRVVKNDFHWAGDYPVPLQYNPDLVQQGAKQIQRSLPTNATDAMHIVPPMDLRGLRQADIQARMDDHLKNKAKWTSNANGTGLVLTWDTGEMVMLQRPDGTLAPYTVSYDLLSKMGAMPAGAAPATGTMKVPDAY